jgi:hypothetical protein
MKRIAFFILFVSLFYNALGYYLMFAQQDEQAWFLLLKTPRLRAEGDRTNPCLIFFCPRYRI